MTASTMHRSALRITLSVWKALMLREALARLFSSRGAWFWLIAEPLAHLAILGFIFSVIRQRHVGGMEIVLWLVIGLIGYFTFRRTINQMVGALIANRALFTYRQVTPVDTVLVRAVLEATLMLIILFCVFAGLALLRYDVIPHGPMTMVAAFFGLWLLALGIGLMLSVLAQLVPETDRVVKMLMRPLYFMSGVLIPIHRIPEPYQTYLMYNPVAHGLELARQGFSEYYSAVQGADMGYLYAWALIALFMGLVLQRRFADFLVTQ